MYKTLIYFVDLQDNNYPYNVGDVFPRIGKEVSDERLLELSTDANRRHKPLIALVEEETPVIEEEPEENFMNPPENVEEPSKEETPKPKKKRGRPRNDAE